MVGDRLLPQMQNNRGLFPSKRTAQWVHVEWVVEGGGGGSDPLYFFGYTHLIRRGMWSANWEKSENRKADRRRKLKWYKYNKEIKFHFQGGGLRQIADGWGIR